VKRAILALMLVGCSGSQPPKGETAVRAAIDIIEFICPPEITVGDCHSRVKAWLPAKDGG
jgi:hypothetical protein